MDFTTLNNCLVSKQNGFQTCLHLKTKKKKKNRISDEFIFQSFTAQKLTAGLIFQYYDEKNCRNDAPLYLLIGGGITVGMTLLKLVAWFTPCEFDDKLASFLTPLANLANF